MTIRHKCPNCGAKRKTDDSLGGQAEQCPSCHQVTQVPLSKAQLAQQKAAEQAQAAQLQQQQAADLEQRKARVIISTGGIDRPHTILQIVFAAGIQKFGGKGLFTRGSEFISDAKYNGMLEEVYVAAISIFREKAARVGADAITHARFDIEQIELREKGLVSEGNALRIQVFCTGTAVRFTA